MRENLPHGTTLEWEDGALVMRRDRDGSPQAVATWDAAGLRSMRVVGHGGAWLALDGARRAHPVLGEVHALSVDGVEVACASAVDWRAPTAIPAIDRPAALPPGAGTMLLDQLARCAVAAGVTALRYAGPYPTAALWASLAASFRSDGREGDFTADATARWGGGALPPIAIDFQPAPHERVTTAPGVIVQLRDSVERATIDGVTFDRSGGVRRLVPDGDGWAAVLWLGDRAWGTRARLGVDGALVERAAIPPATGEPAGQVLPPALAAALRELVDDALPAPLTSAAIAHLPIVWGDPGLAAAADRGDHLLLHVGLWQHLAPHGLARVALALAEALTPLALTRAVRDLR